MSRIFLLSPANCAGARGRMLMSERASFRLAQQLRGRGAPIGEVFSFVSGLYFRGKLAYGLTFARPPLTRSRGVGTGVFVITPSAGLQPVQAPLTLGRLHEFAGVDVSARNASYRRPLESSARRLAAKIGSDCQVVLLGSIASAKYVDVLTTIFGLRLVFPIEFVGRGDMSRGGLMLRRVTEGRELEYVPVVGALRHGPRPPKLEPLNRPNRAAG